MFFAFSEAAKSEWFTLLGLFFTYSFLGWTAETSVAAVRRKSFLNRGLMSGPLCCVYGVAAVSIQLLLVELHDSLFFLFLGSTILCSFLEWATARSLERMGSRRWWDYSHIRWNLDGYICVPYSLLWGILGTLSVRVVTPLLLKLGGLLPQHLLGLGLTVLTIVALIDYVCSVISLMGLGDKLPVAEEINNDLLSITVRLGTYLTRQTERRMQRAYPLLERERQRREASAVFAEGCGFYKLTWLFFIGAFLGDITETLYCRAVGGVWMSRSSLVWGPFSVVWGFAIALASLLLYNQRNRPDSILFAIGTLLGGAYEYLCSVFSELVFGQVFWDYSKIPFNLGGRINLLYCFFWGIAAVVWLKVLYPIFSGWIEKIPKNIGPALTWVIAVFMSCNMLVSALALVRSTQRAMGVPAYGSVSVWLDTNYDDETLARIYPNAIRVS